MTGVDTGTADPTTELLVQSFTVTDFLVVAGLAVAAAGGLVVAVMACGGQHGLRHQWRLGPGHALALVVRALGVGAAAAGLASFALSEAASSELLAPILPDADGRPVIFDAGPVRAHALTLEFLDRGPAITIAVLFGGMLIAAVATMLLSVLPQQEREGAAPPVPEGAPVPVNAAAADRTVDESAAESGENGERA